MAASDEVRLGSPDLPKCLHSPFDRGPMARVAQPAASNRLISLDAYRGFVMLAMASDGMGLKAAARAAAIGRASPVNSTIAPGKGASSGI